MKQKEKKQEKNVTFLNFCLFVFLHHNQVKWIKWKAFPIEELMM